MDYYKPYIRVKIFADIQNSEARNKYPPIIINKYPDDLELSCTIKRDALQGNFALTCLLDVVNLNPFIKWQLLNNKYRYMIVYTGYLGTNYYNTMNDLATDRDYENYLDSNLKVIFKGYILWMGNIVEARSKTTTRFFSVQNPAETLGAYTEAMSLRFNAGYNLYKMINDIVLLANNPDVKMNLSEEEYEAVINNKAVLENFTRKSIDNILNLYGITITQGFDMTEGYITEDTYIQMNSRYTAPDEIVKNNVVTVDEDRGLINIPTLQTSGNYPTVRFKMLFNSRVKNFEYVKLRNADIQLPSEIDDASDVPNVANSGVYLDNSDYTLNSEGKRQSTGWGYYLVLTITYSLTSRGNDFIQEIEASPYDTYNKAKNGV